MRDKKYSYMFVIIGLLLITFTSVVLYAQWTILSTQNEILEIISSHATEEEIHKNYDILERFILNQEKTIDLWWNTILNQSGLSIIFAVIILIMQVIFKELQKENMDKTIDKKMKEQLSNVKELEKDFETLMKLSFYKTGVFEPNRQLDVINSKIIQLNETRNLSNYDTDNAIIDFRKNLQYGIAYYIFHTVDEVVSKIRDFNFDINKYVLNQKTKKQIRDINSLNLEDKQFVCIEFEKFIMNQREKLLEEKENTHIQSLIKENKENGMKLYDDAYNLVKELISQNDKENK